MKTIYIVPIEPIETRYTVHWYEYLPKQICKSLNVNVKQIESAVLSNETTTGAFLNFESTVYYKSEQMKNISKLFFSGLINDGDVFLVTDAWNPSVHFIRYMADLQDKKIKIVGIWHAGSYDNEDFLGKKFKDKTWSFSMERSMFYLYDLNIFATHFHKNLFLKTLELKDEKTLVCGFPMEYYPLDIKYTNWNEKEDIVLFPHRISDEKQPNLFNLLAKENKNLNFIFAQKICKNKDEYHRLLEKTKIVFSANLQETLGISMYEGMLAGAIPIVPNRLSYKEMYKSEFKYENEDIESLNLMINKYIDNPPFDLLKENMEFLNKNYFSGYTLYKSLIEV